MENGLALHNSGRALLCCQSHTHLKDKNGNEIYWDTHRLEDALNSPTRQEIIDAMHRGEWHLNCEDCYAVEQSGSNHSRRLFSTEQHGLSNKTDLRLLDLKLGNTCNLACRSCYPEISSKWVNEYFVAFEQPSGVTKDDYLKRWSRIKTSYAEDNDSLWNDLKHQIPNIKYIDIYGGEPFLTKRLWEILKYSADNGYSQNQEIHINTNGTIWNEDYINTVQAFNEVQLSLSIDAIGEQAEYIRYGLPWNEVSSSIKKYTDLNILDNIVVSACITVGVYNIYRIVEITKQIEANFGIGSFYNLIHYPKHSCIQTMPLAYKQKVRKKVESDLLDLADESFLEDEQKDEIKDILNFMDTDLVDPHIEVEGNVPSHMLYWNFFMDFTERLDEVRNQNCTDVLPEIAEHLNRYPIKMPAKRS